VREKGMVENGAKTGRATSPATCFNESGVLLFLADASSHQIRPLSSVPERQLGPAGKLRASG